MTYTYLMKSVGGVRRHIFGMDAAEMSCLCKLVWPLSGYLIHSSTFLGHFKLLNLFYASLRGFNLLYEQKA